MLSLQFIRENTQELRDSLAKRHQTAPIDEILALDEQRRRLLQEAETLKAQRNEVSKRIGKMKDKPPELIAEMRQVGERIKTLDEEIGGVEGKLNDFLLIVPNPPHPTVPTGKDERDNPLLRHWGSAPGPRHPAPRNDAFSSL